MSQSIEPQIQTFFDKETFSFTHLVWCPASKHAALIDPLLNYEPNSASISTNSIETIMAHIHSQQLDLKWILETHVHADHLSAGHWLREKTGCPIAIGSGIQQVQETFNEFFGFADALAAKVTDFDRTLADGDQLELGDCKINVLHTPGHTPSCCTYQIGNNAFVGDTLFMPDFGSARCDFPGGNARQLYASIQRIFSLGDKTVLYMCHDYMPGGRELAWQSTVAEQRQGNIHINDEVSKDAFIQMRKNRDKTLNAPKLILPALQVNIRAGQMPPSEADGHHYLRIPLNRFASL